MQKTAEQIADDILAKTAGLFDVEIAGPKLGPDGKPVKKPVKGLDYYEKGKKSLQDLRVGKNPRKIPGF